MKTALSLFVISLVSASLAFASTGDNSFKSPVGLQLWSLRNQFKKDVPEALKQLKGLGVTQAETAGTYGIEPAKFRQMLLDAGVQPISGHFDFGLLEKDPSAVSAQAKALGLKYVGCAWVPHQGAFTEAEARHAIKVFTHAGEVMAKNGMRFFYHAHGYEFQPFGDGTLLDLIIKECPADKVSFQLDTTWVYLPGQDPVVWLKKYPTRWISLHMKDLKKGVERGTLSGGTDINNDVVLGTGQIDWKAVLKTSQEIGVKFYVIEDESDAILTQVPQSVKFLSDIRW
ncbi:MAG: sugar phosphate isomerase/epimerase [Opitutaceae bacterium]|jgi:sugar phosphate isomerase/epimerase